MNLTIFRKGLILVTLPLLFQLVFVGLVARMQSEHAEATARAAHTKQVISQAETVLRTLLDAQTGSRGFVMTGDSSFSEPYEQAKRQMPAELGRLERLVQDNPAQLSQVGTIRSEVEEVMQWLSDLDVLTKAGNHQEAIARTATGRGEQEMDGMRRAMLAFVAEEERLDQVRQGRLELSRAGLQRLLIAGALLAFLSTACLAFFFSRGISRRLAVLTENARLLTENKPLAPAVPGNDEIALLDRVFHAMAGSLAKAAQQERQYMLTLEKRVAERTHELAEANVELRQKNQENETFVYSVSHDLRSPLVNLQGFSKELAGVCTEVREILLQNDLPAAVRDRGLQVIDGDMGQSIRFIQTAVLRLGNIIDALLRLSRAGRVEYQMQRLDLNGIVSRIAESMSGTAFERGATIEIDELPAAWGDATAVEQIFANLIGNALKFLDPQRPGAVRIGTIQEETAEGTETPPGSWHTYYVKDNGLGISPGVQPKLFQAFKRFHPHVAEGEGMGLAIVRRMVERHGGRVRVESAVGSGTVFYVTLPAQRGSETAGKNNTSEAKWEEIHGERTVGHCVSGR